MTGTDIECSTADLCSSLRAEEIDDEVSVWADGMGDDWKSMSPVPELAMLLPPSPLSD